MLSLSLVTAVPVSAASIINVPGDYLTIQDAIDAAQPGDTIIVAAGTYAGATVTKAVIIKGEGAVIDTGPLYNPTGFQYRAGFLFPGQGVGSGATISGFVFQGKVQPVRNTDDGGLDLPIYSYGADSVTIKNNVMTDSNQAISNWHGSDWKIRNNTIDGLWVLSGGGIGIFIGSRYGTPANDNFVGFNRITAVIVADTGNYSNAGICLMSDARYPNPPWNFIGGPVQDNKVLHNDVAVVTTLAGQPTDLGHGIQLTESPPPAGQPIVVDNKVVQNDPGGSTLAVSFYPAELQGWNVIHNNPGEGEGHGLPPAAIY